MARVDEGADVPISPLSASSSNLGSPGGFRPRPRRNGPPLTRCPVLFMHAPVARTRAQSHLHILMRVTHTHCSSVCVTHTHASSVYKKVFAYVSFSLHLAFSLLMSHPSFAVSVRLSLSLSRLSRPHVLAVLTCPKSAGHAHLCTRTRSLAMWPSPALNTSSKISEIYCYHLRVDSQISTTTSRPFVKPWGLSPPKLLVLNRESVPFLPRSLTQNVSSLTTQD